MLAMTFQEKLQKLKEYEAKQSMLGQIFEFQVDTSKEVINITKYYDKHGRSVVIIPEFADYLSDDGGGIFAKSKYITKVIMGPNIKGDVSHLFAKAICRKLDLTEFDTSNIVNMREMFTFSEIGELVLGGKFRASNVENMSGMFCRFKSIRLDLSGLDVSKVIDMSEMFSTASIDEVILGKNFNANSVQNINSMFEYSRIGKIDLGNFKAPNIRDMRSMFYGCNVNKINLSGIDAAQVEDMSHVFQESETKEIIFGERFNTSKAKDMGHLFAGCKTDKLDLSSFDTSKVQRMNSMFCMCTAEEIVLGPKFSTSNAIYMDNMFHSCRARSLNLRSFDTSKVVGMSGMFQLCTADEILFGDNFDTSNTIRMNKMFRMCAVKSIELGKKFKTIKAADLRNMFYAAQIDSLNIGDKFELKSAKAVEGLFSFAHIGQLYIGNFVFGPVNDGKLIFQGLSVGKIIIGKYMDDKSVEKLKELINEPELVYVNEIVRES